MNTDIKFPENIITNRVNSSKVALLITAIVLSVMMVITTAVAEFDDKSIIPSITLLASFVGIIASVIISMSLKRIVYAQTESPMRRIEILFAESKGDVIANAAAGNRWSLIPTLAKTSHGTAMKLEIAYSSDLSFAAYQFFRYVPHSYESCSQIFYIDKDDIKRINFAELKS